MFEVYNYINDIHAKNPILDATAGQAFGHCRLYLTSEPVHVYLMDGNMTDVCLCMYNGMSVDVPVCQVSAVSCQVPGARCQVPGVHRCVSYRQHHISVPVHVHWACTSCMYVGWYVGQSVDVPVAD